MPVPSTTRTPHVPLSRLKMAPSATTCAPSFALFDGALPESFRSRPSSSTCAHGYLSERFFTALCVRSVSIDSALKSILTSVNTPTTRIPGETQASGRHFHILLNSPKNSNLKLYLQSPVFLFQIKLNQYTVNQILGIVQPQ